MLRVVEWKVIGIVTAKIIPRQKNWRDGDQQLEWLCDDIDDMKSGDIFVDHEDVLWIVTAVKAFD